MLKLNNKKNNSYLNFLILKKLDQAMIFNQFKIQIKIDEKISHLNWKPLISKDKVLIWIIKILFKKGINNQWKIH